MKKFFLFLLIIIAVLFIVNNYASKNQYDDLNAITLENIEKLEISNNKTLGIAFGGGGVRGFMHLGVIKALEEAGIKPDIVTGSSAGSIAASLYATGMSYKEIERIVTSLQEKDLADINIFSDGGLIGGKKLSTWIQNNTNNIAIENTPIKLGIAVTDLTHGKPLLITRGDMGKAVQTSSTVPVAFVPINSNGNIYIDGGILSLIPIRFTRAMGADIVIGVDIYCGKKNKPKEEMLNIAMATLRLQSCEISKEEQNEADFIIRPDFEPKSFSSFDSKEESIKAGYKATKLIIENLKKKLL